MLKFLREIFKHFNFLEFLTEMFFVFFFLSFFNKTYFVTESNCIHSPERKIILEPRVIHSTYTSTCRNISHSYTFNIHFNLQEYISQLYILHTLQPAGIYIIAIHSTYTSTCRNISHQVQLPSYTFIIKCHHTFSSKTNNSPRG